MTLKNLLMKKNIFYFLSLTIATTSFAQFKGRPKETLFSGGPKAGVNLSNFYGDTSMKNNLFRINFHGGVFANFAFNNNLSVQTEFIYSPKGSLFKIKTDSSEYNATYSITYLDVPLLFQYKSADNESGLFIQIGGQASFLLNARYSGENKTSLYSSAFSNTDVDSLGLSTSDLGAVLSVGIVGEYGLSFTLRANAGLSDIWEKNNTLVNHNILFQASFGYAFGRKHDVIGGKIRR